MTVRKTPPNRTAGVEAETHIATAWEVEDLFPRTNSTHATTPSRYDLKKIPKQGEVHEDVHMFEGRSM